MASKLLAFLLAICIVQSCMIFDEVDARNVVVCLGLRQEMCNLCFANPMKTVKSFVRLPYTRAPIVT
nr:hypothetical protein Iba_chr14fCG2520 [Ipomoea batatas]